MARTGLTKSQVRTTRDQLLAEGRYPSVDAVRHALGDTGYAKLFPDARPEDRLTWSKYRKATFDHLMRHQNADGSWSSSGQWGSVGPIYSTAIALTILQLDNAMLPIYQR